MVLGDEVAELPLSQKGTLGCRATSADYQSDRKKRENIGKHENMCIISKGRQQTSSLPK